MFQENLPDVLLEQVEPQDWGEEGPSISLTFLTGGLNILHFRMYNVTGYYVLYVTKEGTESESQGQVL